MNWLQRIAEEDNRTMEDLMSIPDEVPWSYKDYSRLKKVDPTTYMSVGHDSSNVILFNVMKDFRIREIGSEELEKIEYKNRNHNLLNPEMDLSNELVNGRIEIDSKKGSISLAGLDGQTNKIRLRVLDIIFNKYSGIDFYIWDGPKVQNMPFLKYWKLIDEAGFS